ncbi:hypothetical protein [Maricaulis maris]|uniref:DUF481 domain-containing protein n=1 Tax=Maricaulis maris TaxID=74318 RepID=A0A495D1G4_9PROT|nr:hypothetical protein [Maricaulis maris]RKQ95375.1 hypothetical protein C7435_3074 [Maricaulis maris]
MTTLVDRADTRFDGDRRRSDDGYFHKDETATYLEYGLSGRDTMVVRIAWQDVRRSRGQSYDEARGLAASEIGWRRQVWRRDATVASLQATALIPGQGENVANQAFGSGEMAAELRALLGQGLGRHGFVEAQTAWRWRDGEYLDEARLDLTAGWRVTDRWQVLAQSFSVWSVETDRPGTRAFDQHKLQLSVSRELGAQTIQIGASFTPTGRNAINQQALFLSVWRRF